MLRNVSRSLVDLDAITAKAGWLGFSDVGRVKVDI